jgi:hypothetical protein
MCATDTHTVASRLDVDGDRTDAAPAMHGAMADAEG